MPVRWDCAANPRFEFVGDSMLIIPWLNGAWNCRYRLYQKRIQLGQQSLTRFATEHDVRPRECAGDWGRHIFRELNGYADGLANRHDKTWWVSHTEVRYQRHRSFFDGSVTVVAAARIKLVA